MSLIVPNAIGARDCERLVTALYGAAGAGTYPSNLGRPEFRDGGRAHRLARAAGLSVDPGVNVPRMIEVFPHAAIVSLFGLDQRIAYKAKHGREADGQQKAFLELLRHVESLRRFSL